MGDVANTAPLIVKVSAVLVALVAGGRATASLYHWWRAVRSGWRRIDATIHAIAVEFAPNGGSTMRDAVDRLERGQTPWQVDLVSRVQQLEQAGTPPIVTTNVVVDGSGGSSA